MELPLALESAVPEPRPRRLRTALSGARALALGLPFKPDELHKVQTPDGWFVALGRYRPLGPRRAREPVLLCHGLGANRFNLDLDERYSLARYLRKRGFDAWVLELRGRGLASGATPGARPFTFDEQAQHDVATALARVREAAGAERVHWVGHSKGGMLAYAHLALGGGEHLASFVSIAAPGTFHHQPYVRKLIRRARPFLRLPWIPASLMRVMAPLGFSPPRAGLLKMMANPQNIDATVAVRALGTIPSPVAGGVMRQYASWIHSGRFCSNDGRVDYIAGLRDARVPALVLAGAADEIAPPAAVAVAFDALGSSDKRMVVASVDNGFSADYGHGDLALGRRAPEEIYPLIAQFLAERSRWTE